MWLILLTTALLLNAVLLVWLLTGETAPAPTPVPAEIPAPIPALATAPLEEPVAPRESVSPRPAPAAAGWESLPQEPAALAQPATRAPAEKRPSPAAETRTFPEPPPALPRLADLSPDLRQRLPELGVSLHYYTADPGARLARINGLIFREGGEIGSGLVLEEITPSEIILRLGDLRFRMGNF